MVRDGYLYGGSLLAVAALVGWWTGNWAWAVIPVLLAAFFLWFFRDPHRDVPQGEGLVVSPADGVLTSIERIQTPAGEKFRLSIFLSVVDVHVNRAPIAGVIRGVRYHKGKYLNAMNPDSAEQNEQNIVEVEGDDGYAVTFKQIAGLLARRIVFTKNVGDRVERGERVGLIKFGSRTDIILPAHAKLRVTKGVRVKGGETILAEIEVPDLDPELAGTVTEVLV
jgi:phosphatidylserine decarboxylase